MNQIFPFVIFILILSSGTTGCSNAKPSSTMTVQQKATTVELTTFNLLEGTDETEFIKVAQQMQAAFLNHQEGFIKRTLVKGENGWTDVVYWQDPQSLGKAMQKAEVSPDAATFMQLIDFASVQMQLSEIKMETQK